MYSRLTPHGRTARFAAFKVFGWITAIVTVAGTASAVLSDVREWWNSERSRPAFTAPPVMATTSQRQYTPPVSTPPPHQDVEALHYDPAPYIAPTPEPPASVIIRVPDPVRIPVYVEPSTVEVRPYNPFVTNKPLEKMQPVPHRSRKSRPQAASPPARKGKR
jgi:hypothetical protein